MSRYALDGGEGRYRMSVLDGYPITPGGGGHHQRDANVWDTDYTPPRCVRSWRSGQCPACGKRVTFQDVYQRAWDLCDDLNTGRRRRGYD